MAAGTVITVGNAITAGTATIATTVIIAIIITGAAGNGRCAVRARKRDQQARGAGLFSCATMSREIRTAGITIRAPRRYQEVAMKTLIGAAVIAGVLALAAPAAIDPAIAASPKADARAAEVSKPTGSGARHRYRSRARYAYRPYYQPYYYDRPIYYRPYPYDVPVPFFLGVGFGPQW